jgi:hypothetical protein
MNARPSSGDHERPAWRVPICLRTYYAFRKQPPGVRNGSNATGRARPTYPSTSASPRKRPRLRGGAICRDNSVIGGQRPPDDYVVIDAGNVIGSKPLRGPPLDNRVLTDWLFHIAFTFSCNHRR